jgi:predicted dehydrogenase
MSAYLHRRHFLQSSAALAAACTLPGPAAAVGQGLQPTDRVRLAIVGVSGQGGRDLTEVVRTGLADIAALCDVDQQLAAPVRRKFPQARFYDDYRRMLEQKDIHAVLVATPDHHHAFAAVGAMRASKHVFCQKPLAHSVHEVRVMMETASRHKVVTQMGTQVHASNNYRRVVEIIQGGVLGQVRRVHVWCEKRPDAMVRAKESQPPKTLNYDLWLGPAPARSYPPYRLGANGAHGIHQDWRWWWDFGGGILADMACHYMDLPHWALNLRQPTTVAAQGRVTYQGDNNMPDLLQVDYEYPARGDQPPVHLTWYHGMPGPDLAGKVRYAGYPSGGVLFEGAKGRLIADFDKHQLLPEERFKDFQPPPRTIAASVGHYREWLQAIRDSGQTTCNFDYSGALTETVLLGNVAYRAGGGKLQYDAKTGRVSGNNNAEQYLRRDYRRGWTL